MRILLTGAYGFIGRNLVDYFHRQGIFVASLTESKKSNPTLSAEIRVNKFLDLEQDKRVAKVINQLDFDTVVHAAGLIDDSFPYSELYSANVRVTEVMAKLALKNGINKFIHLSSVCIVGYPINLPIDEATPVKPTTNYHKSKLESEISLQKIGVNELTKIILRLPAPVGLYMPRSRLIMRIVHSIRNHEDPTIYSNGSRVQNYLDIRDLGRAIELAYDHNNSELLLVPGKSTISNLELAEQIINISGQKRKVKFENRVDPCNGEKWIINGKKIEALLNYAPTYPISDAIENILRTQ